MKIALLSSGCSIHVNKIAKGLAERGHEIILYTLPDHDKLITDFDSRIKIKKLPVKGKTGYFLNAPYIRQQLKKNQVDLVNSHYASGYGTLARFVGRHPLVLAVFGTDIYEYPFRSKTNMKLMIKNLDCADVITSTSQVMANKVREFYHRDRPIYVTPFGVDLSRFHPVDAEKDDVFEIGTVKKLEEKYGIDYLLRAFHILQREYGVSKSRLVIYGRGSAEGKYKALAEQLSLKECVRFCSFIQNEKVPEAFSHMDVACFPSIQESFGVAAVEAMACGIPVITSNAPGFTEVVEDEMTGLIVAKEDEKALADALYRIYKMNPEKRREMGKAGVKRVKQLYNFEENMDMYEEILKKVFKP